MPLNSPSSASRTMYPGSEAFGISEEVARSVLQTLVVRQKDGCPVPQTVLEQNPMQAGLLPGVQAEHPKWWPSRLNVNLLSRAVTPRFASTACP